MKTQPKIVQEAQTIMSSSTKTPLEPVIGLEIHTQLLTKSKVFSRSANVFGASPNTLTDPTVVGMPGSLPVLNQRVVDLAVRLGLAMQCHIRPISYFARKHYFYPDSPKGYQITQHNEPICEHGTLSFFFNKIRQDLPITRIHIEEDTGKNSHQGNNTSLIDLNRAGVALCEVVSAPMLHSAAEAAAALRALRQLVRYLNVSDGNMDQGSMRCDANISLRPQGDTSITAPRVELKNINSFKFVEQAIDYEIQRQTKAYHEGVPIVEETRLWDHNKGRSLPLRKKDNAWDYRFFHDPDLPPLHVSEETIKKINNDLIEHPTDRCQRFVDIFSLSFADAFLIVEEKSRADFFDQTVTAFALLPEQNETTAKATAQQIANWFLSELLGVLYGQHITNAYDSKVSPNHLALLVLLITKRTITRAAGKEVLIAMIKTGNDAQTIVNERKLECVTDQSNLETMIDELLKKHPDQMLAYQKGKEGLLGFFVGKIMQNTRGTADPKIVRELVKHALSRKV